MGGHPVTARLVQTEPFGEGDCIRDQVATRSTDHSETLLPRLSSRWFNAISDPALLSSWPYLLLHRRHSFETPIRHALPPREMESLTRVSFSN